MEIEVNGRKQIAYMIFCHAIITCVNNCVLWGFQVSTFCWKYIFMQCFIT